MELECTGGNIGSMPLASSLLSMPHELWTCWTVEKTHSGTRVTEETVRLMPRVIAVGIGEGALIAVGYEQKPS